MARPVRWAGDDGDEQERARLKGRADGRPVLDPASSCDVVPLCVDSISSFRGRRNDRRTLASGSAVTFSVPPTDPQPNQFATPLSFRSTESWSLTGLLDSHVGAK